MKKGKNASIRSTKQSAQGLAYSNPSINVLLLLLLLVVVITLINASVSAEAYPIIPVVLPDLNL